MNFVDSPVIASGIRENVRLLEQACRLLDEIDDSDYVRPCDEVFAASIGQHLRHALEHYDAVFSGMENSLVNYENRRRDPMLETIPSVARSRIEEIFAAFTQIELENISLMVHQPQDLENPSPSSLSRELQFLASHTVHHFAMIAIIAGLTGLVLTTDFGIAPSTLRHRQNA